MGGPGWDPHSQQRRDRLLAHQIPIAGIFRVDDDRHAGRKELRASGFDVEAPAFGSPEPEPAGDPIGLPFFYLGLGHRRLEAHVPNGGSLGSISLPAPQHAKEGALRGPLSSLPDGGVGERPIDGEAQAPEDRLEGRLVGGDQLPAQLHEVGAADRHRPPREATGRRAEVGIMRSGRVAAHPEDLLDPPLGGEAVIVEAHRIEDLPAPHAAEAGDHVGVGVREDVAQVQLPAHRRGWSVDGVDVGARAGAIESVGTLRLPASRPLLLQALQGGPVRGRANGLDP